VLRSIAIDKKVVVFVRFRAPLHRYFKVVSINIQSKYPAGDELQQPGTFAIWANYDSNSVLRGFTETMGILNVTSSFRTM
jgi:hypothetical protein